MNPTTKDRIRPRARSVAAAAGFAGIALFQLALALGAPMGQAAWGSTHQGALPTGLRVASGVAVLIWTAAALVLLRRGGSGPSVLPEAVAR